MRPRALPLFRRLAIAVLAVGLFPSLVVAQDEPKSVTGSYSPYEQASIDKALSELGTKLDTQADGKRIEGIEVVSLEVIEPRDPVPGWLTPWLNSLHTTTRKYVIEREVLMRPGDPYQRVLCDETARNLRLLPQLSLVICTAIAGSSDDAVRVLVLTKDVWSLRLGWDVLYVGGGLEHLQIVPTETNVAGTHQTVLTRYVYRPESRAVSVGYQIPRFAGRRIALAAETGIIWNRDGKPEGSTGSLAAGKPLFSARTEWGWALGVGWRDEIARLYRNARLRYDPSGVPWAYRAERSTFGANMTRSFGWIQKSDFTLGVEMNLQTYRPPEVAVRDTPTSSEEPQGFPLPPSNGPRPTQADVDTFVDRYVPRSDRRVGPFLQYRAYTSDFMRALNLETLGLQEDFRLGHNVVLRVYPVAQALGSSRSFFGTYAAAQYTLGIGDGLARAGVEVTMEAESDRLSDAWIQADARLVTPELGFGRFVADASAFHRPRNYMKQLSYLGGGGRLRGYPSNYFVGKDIVAYNLEFRSRPVEILACQVGGAVFYDAGHAAASLDGLRLHHAVGIGFRVLFPQLNRLVFRGDVGLPLTDPKAPGMDPVTFTVAFAQAFSLPAVSGPIASGPVSGWLGQ